MGLDKPIINFEPEDEHLEIAAKKINELLDNTNRKYIEILSQHKITSNMFIIASKI